MSRHWSPPTVLGVEDSERLLRDLEKSCSPEEIERRVEVAKRNLAKMCPSVFAIPESGTFDPAVRAAEKQASRDSDARRLASGEVTPQQLTEENAFIRGPIRILSYGGSPRKRRRS